MIFHVIPTLSSKKRAFLGLKNEKPRICGVQAWLHPGVGSTSSLASCLSAFPDSPFFLCWIQQKQMLSTFVTSRSLILRSL